MYHWLRLFTVVALTLSVAQSGHAAEKPGSVPSPWTLGGARKPDLLAVKAKQGWVIDAKYKGNHSPGAGDQNQMFVYAHLVKFKESHPLRFIALAYPSGSGDEDVLKVPCSLRASLLHDGAAETGPRLVRFQIPFPQADALESVDSWRRYLRDAGQRLHAKMNAARHFPLE